MPDTKRGREQQARREERRQREREIEQARERRDDPEPEPSRENTTDGTDGGGDESPSCHRRGCDEPAAFLVLERYLEDTGHGAVEATATLCREHTAEETPTRLKHVYADYVFRIEPLPGTTDSSDS